MMTKEQVWKSLNKYIPKDLFYLINICVNYNILH